MSKTNMVDTLVKIVNTDGWQNIFTGIGTSKDKLAQTHFNRSDTLSDEMLTNIYRSDGIGARIIDVPANDMLRGWINIEGDSDNKLTEYLEELETRPAITEAIKWSRLYGGSLIVMGIDDGRSSANGKNVWMLPVNENSVRKIAFFRVYDRRAVTWDNTDIDTDLFSLNFGKPLYYTVSDVNAGGLAQYKVHHSRCIRLTGKRLPNREAMDEDGWGDSIMQSVYERLQGFANSLVDTGAILNDFVVGVLNIKNLSDLIASGNDAAVVQRIQLMDQSKHVSNTIVLDEEEKFQRLAAQVNGIKDILEFFKDTLSAYCGIPQIKLFGEQSKGLGAQAAGNIRLYYDDIAQEQEDVLRPVFKRITKLVYKSQDFAVKDTKGWRLDFNNMWQRDDTEESTIRLNMAKTDEIYINSGVLHPETVANSRFGNKTYSIDTVLGPNDAKFNTEMAKKLVEVPKIAAPGDKSSKNPEKDKK
jgi:phage-related protein (TIGR01555 family)